MRIAVYSGTQRNPAEHLVHEYIRPAQKHIKTALSLPEGTSDPDAASGFLTSVENAWELLTYARTGDPLTYLGDTAHELYDELGGLLDRMETDYNHFEDSTGSISKHVDTDNLAQLSGWCERCISWALNTASPVYGDYSYERQDWAKAVEWMIKSIEHIHAMYAAVNLFLIMGKEELSTYLTDQPGEYIKWNSSSRPRYGLLELPSDDSYWVRIGSRRYYGPGNIVVWNKSDPAPTWSCDLIMDLAEVDCLLSVLNPYAVMAAAKNQSGIIQKALTEQDDLRHMVSRVSIIAGYLSLPVDTVESAQSILTA